MKDMICVLIRVYNRVEDLKCNIDIIKQTWTKHEYYIIVSSNGTSDGYNIPSQVENRVDRVLKIDNNVGHLSGNSQLLLEALPYIPSNCLYTILLEADTWLYSDGIIDKYLAEIEANNSVWASAKWYDKCYSLATDFAIVRTSFLLKNKDILKFSKLPECWVANYIIRNNYKYTYIRENMPVLLPSYIKSYPYAPFGRFFVFPYSKMITHHIENLLNGIEEKKFYFNIVSCTTFFPIEKRKSYTYEHMKIKFFTLLTCIFPRKSWFRKNVFLDD